MEPTLNLVYSRSYIFKAYLRVAFGWIFAFSIWFLMPAHTVTYVFVVGTVVMFSCYALQTWLRDQSKIQINSDQISVEGRRQVRIRWDQLKSFDLAYFSTRKDSRNGWMQLKLVGDDSTIRLDSDLERFVDVVSLALSHARMRGLDLSIRTMQNAEILMGSGAHTTAPPPSN